MRIGAANGVGEIRWGGSALHRCMNEKESRLWRRSAQDANHIVQHRARARCDDCNPLRCNGDWAFTGRIKETFSLELSSQRLKFLGEESNPAWTDQRACNQLIPAARGVEINPADQDHDLADRWNLLTRTNAPAESDRIER
jgi:hypothetical protein